MPPILARQQTAGNAERQRIRKKEEKTDRIEKTASVEAALLPPGFGTPGVIRYSPWEGHLRCFVFVGGVGDGSVFLLYMCELVPCHGARYRTGD